MSHAARPWEIRREAERDAIRAHGQRIRARTARALPDLSAQDRTEAERLIALPYGAEGNALDTFIVERQLGMLASAQEVQVAS